MTLEKFMTVLKEEVQHIVNENCLVEIHYVGKNNVGQIPALNIMEKGVPLSPNFYLNDLYREFRESGISVAELAEKLVEIHYKNIMQCRELDISHKFENPEQAREILFFRLVNYEKNRQMLEEVPHVKILDLALVYYLLADRGEERIGSMRASHRMFRHFGWDAEEMRQDVLANTVRLFPENVSPLSRVLGKLLGIAAEEGETSFGDVPEDFAGDDLPLILTNTGGINGATVLVYPDLLRRIAGKIRFNLFLLPSSVHEFLVLPDNGDYPLDELERMVVAVNQGSVEAEEVLSDRVYYYDAGTDRLTVAGRQAEETEGDSPGS